MLMLLLTMLSKLSPCAPSTIANANATAAVGASPLRQIPVDAFSYGLINCDLAVNAQAGPVAA